MSKSYKALRAAGFEPTEAYRKHCAVLARTLVYDGPFEPVHQRDAACQMQTRKMARNQAYSLGWHGGDPRAFFEAAKTLPHPATFEENDLPADVCAVVRFAVQ